MCAGAGVGGAVTKTLRSSSFHVVLQNRAVVNLFRGPNLIEDVATTMRRLEEGDLKLRVRALDSERALTRVLVGLLACMYCKEVLAAQSGIVL